MYSSPRYRSSRCHLLRLKLLLIVELERLQGRRSGRRARSCRLLPIGPHEHLLSHCHLVITRSIVVWDLDIRQILPCSVKIGLEITSDLLCRRSKLFGLKTSSTHMSLSHSASTGITLTVCLALRRDHQLDTLPVSSLPRCGVVSLFLHILPPRSGSLLPWQSEGYLRSRAGSGEKSAA